jgi:hypothetical protein
MKKIITATALAACIGLPSIATAALISTSTPGETHSYTFTSLNDNIIFTYAGFDATLGTLQAVRFEWTTDKTLTSTAANLTGLIPGTAATPILAGDPTPLISTSTTTFAGQGVAIDLMASDVLTTPGFTDVINPSYQNGIVTPVTIGTASAISNGVVCLSNSATASCGTGADNIQGYATNTPITFNMSVSNSDDNVNGSLNGLYVSNSRTTSVSATIFYDYLAPGNNNIPEPAPMPLMGLGLGLGLLALQGTARKKRQS